MVAGTSGISRPGGPSGNPLPQPGGALVGPAGQGPGASIAGSGAEVAAWLELVLDTLLPANEEIPAAGQMELAKTILLDAQWIPELGEALRWLSGEIPASFASATAQERIAVLTELEAAQPRLFSGVVNLAYNAYYTDARVLALVERKAGFTATPPQPLGYEIEPFDPGVLATIKDRPPFWRHS
jgi:hypothetical protein